MSYKTLQTILLGLILCLGACAPAEDDLSDSRRGRVGKADHVAGSCIDACGGQSSGTCWCDELCKEYGDCCEDAGDACGVDECTDAGSGCHEGDVCVTGEPNLCTSPASCSPQDAAGVGMCEAFFGYAWNGLECVGLTGCSCEGADCGTWLSLAECESTHTQCLPGPGCPDPADPAVEYKTYDTGTCAAIRFTCPEGWEPFSNECGCGCTIEQKHCGGILARMCDEGEYCDYGAHCGSGDQSGICRPQPDFCTANYEPVCGCDGATYGNACNAASAGVSVESPGACAPSPDSCEGHCGGSSEDGSCWCDAVCVEYGDCCADKADVCS